MEEKQIYDVKSEGYDPPPELSEDDVFKILSQGKTLVFEELEEGEIKDILRRLGMEVSIPLVTESEEMGLLVCGAKESGEIYSDGDLKVLDILAPEAAVAIQNAKAYEEIKRFSVTLQEEVEKATHDLQVANEKLKDLDKLKDEFVSVASHELRTPMTAIKSYLWMALAGRGGELTEKQKYYVDRAYISADRLIRLVNNMLNVSRIESGRIEIELEKLDISRLARDVVDEVTPRANELGIRVTCHEQKDLPEVLADPDKIKEVLINLIGNSLKFTPKGGSIEINFNVKNDMVETSVSDTGKGIAKEDMPKLFKKFGLIEGSYASTQQDGGTGLGLYITWNIILLHHGTIKAESEGLGKGATFTFSLPIFKEEDLAKIKKKEEGKEAVGLVSVGI
jgi:signal transduction histidine kinase